MTTVTIYRYLHSELENLGENEDFNENQITFFDPKWRFLPRISRYDDDVVHGIVTFRLFRGNTLSEDNIDREFKRMYVNRFMNREIDFETIDLFANHNTYAFLSMKGIIENTIKDIVNFSIGANSTHSVQDDNSVNKFRGAFQDTPQDQINLDLNDNSASYATNTNVSNSGVKTDNVHDSLTKNYNPQNHKESLMVLDDIFKEFDKRCFLKVFG